MKPKEIIEDIRRSEYMVGVQLSGDVAKGPANLRRKLNRALRLLSEELYSSETHFVLELVQNADDNAYANGVVPKVTFRLAHDRLEVINNEAGFSESNVRALCDVGSSTKSRKSGFIGEKGIGFKSVFKVCDRPEVHSNGFHFRFDRTSEEDLLGFVVPQWCPPAAAIAPGLTTIVLPAKEARPFDGSLLSELHPELLLFLRQLREIERVAPNDHRRYVRDDGVNVVRISSYTLLGEQGANTEESTSYLRIAHDVPMHDIAEEKRPGVRQSEVVLAFPIGDKGQAAPNRSSPVFAFLPVRSFGFTFSIQGDFLLNTSREDILADRPWNRRLRDSIAPAIISGLESFKQSSIANSFLQFVPADDDVKHPFFAPVTEQLVKSLKGAKCVRGATGEWRRPSEVMLAPKDFQALVSPTDALRLFAKDYPHPELKVGTKTLEQLGCPALTYGDLGRLFDEYPDWLRAQGHVWLAKFYVYLASLKREELLRSGLAAGACLLDDDGAFVSPSAARVFYPLARRKKYGFEHELTILNEEVLDAALALNEDVRGLFDALGVRKAGPYETVTDHILPRHSNEDWKTSGHPALIGHLRYVKENLRPYLEGAQAHGLTPAEALARLRDGLWVGTKKRTPDGRWYFDRAPHLYLSREFKPDFCIETLLGQDIVPDHLVASEYLPARAQKGDATSDSAPLEEWRQFLVDIGVNDVPRVERDSPSSDSRCSKELESLLTSANEDVRRATLRCLDQNWHRYSDHTSYYSRFGRSATLIGTTFARELRAVVAPTKRKRRNVVLCRSFYPSEAVVEVFGASADYVDVELSSPDFLDACGITHRVDIDACLTRLRQIKSSQSDARAGVHRIYRQLERLFAKDPNRIKNAFRSDALIHVKGHSGEWFAPEGVCWSSHGPFLDAIYPSLGDRYREYHTFFVRQLGVSKDLSIERQIEALVRLNELPDGEQRASEALRILQRASRELGTLGGAGGNGEPDWLETLREQPVFPNHRGEMVANDGALFFDDAPAVSRLFHDRAGLSFLAVSPGRLPQIRALLEAAGVPSVSESVVQDVLDPGDGVRDARLTEDIRTRLGHIARLVYFHHHAAFERARDAGAFRRLASLEVARVPQLEVRASLCGEEATTQGEVALLDSRVLVSSAVRGAVDRIALKLCELLQAPVDFADGISRILLARDTQEIDDFLEVKGIGLLPDDEQAKFDEFLQGQPSVEPPVEPANREDIDESEQLAVEDEEQSAELSQPPVNPRETTTSGASAKRLRPEVEQRGRLRPDGSHKDEHEGRSAGPGGAEGSPSGRDRSGIKPKSEHEEQVARGSTGTTSFATDGDTPDVRASPPLAGGRQRKRARKRSLPERASRLLSYADAPRADSAIDGGADAKEEQRRRDEVGQAAVDFIVQRQPGPWTKLKPMEDPYNEGYDILGWTSDGQEQYIEVKGQSGAWNEAGVALTPAELRCAERHRDRYWLCVVEFVHDAERRRFYLVNNPFGKTDQFRFDSGWKGTAANEATEPTLARPLQPEAGLRIEIEGRGTGSIVSAKKQGVFFRLHVQLDNGQQFFGKFVPASMHLSQPQGDGTR